MEVSEAKRLMALEEENGNPLALIGIDPGGDDTARETDRKWPAHVVIFTNLNTGFRSHFRPFKRRIMNICEKIA